MDEIENSKMKNAIKILVWFFAIISLIMAIKKGLQR